MSVLERFGFPERGDGSSFLRLARDELERWTLDELEADDLATYYARDLAACAAAWAVISSRYHRSLTPAEHRVVIDGLLAGGFGAISRLAAHRQAHERARNRGDEIAGGVGMWR